MVRYSNFSVVELRIVKMAPYCSRNEVLSPDQGQCSIRRRSAVVPVMFVCVAQGHDFVFLDVAVARTGRRLSSSP